MKAMKKLMIVAATLTLGTSAFYAVACNEDEHEHKYSWTVVTEATCTEDGEEKGVCEICNDEQTRPISATGHTYGDWYVTAPSRGQKGKAVRLCAADASHRNEVELPALPVSGNGEYKSATPVAGSDYAHTYVYDADGEEISFTGYSFDANSISAAVAVATETNSNAIKSNSTHATLNHGTGATSSSAVNLEFGDGYVHIVDNTQKQEMWYEKQPDGSSFNALKFYDRLGNQSVKLDERDDALQLYDGYGFYFVWVYSNHYDYGAGNFLNYYYQQAQNNENGDFKESVAEVDGKTVYTFSYSVYDTTYYSEYAGGDHLNVLSFSFTLASNGVIEKLTATNNTYTNTKDTQGEAPDGTPTFTPGETNFEQGDNGWVLVEGANVSETETWIITQKTALEAGEALPTTPYHYEDMVATSFDLERVNADGDFEITEELGALGDEVDLTATAPLMFALKNVAPSTANFYVDDLKFYWRTVDEDGNNVDTLLASSYGNGEDWHIKATFDPVTGVGVVNCYVAGDHTLVIKTANVEKIITLHVPYTAPTGMKANVSNFDVKNNTYTWDSVSTYYRIYQGEKLCFNSTVDHPAYQNASYTATVEGPQNVTLEKQMLEGSEVSVFTATEEGVYTITVKSTVNNSSSTLQVKVLEAPDEVKFLEGNPKTPYTGVDRNGNPVTITFDTTAKTALIDIGELKEGKGSIYSKTLTYEYTAAHEDEAPAIAVAKDPDSDFTFSFEVTSGYEVVFNYKDEFGEFKRVYISNAVKNILPGTYSLGADGNYKQTIHTANVGEVYALSSASSFMYSINGVMKNEKEENGSVITVSTATFNLEVGDVLKVWSTHTGTYTLTVYKPTTTADLTLDKDTAEVAVGGTALQLKATVDPDVSFKGLTWSSSDESVATVSSTGVITAKKAGDVIITVASSKFPEAFKTCNVHVVYNKATSITLDKTTAEMEIGGSTLTLTATVGPENASNKKVVWESMDETIATVSANGVVTVNPNLKANTTVVITATSVDSTSEHPITTYCTITVKYVPVTEVTLNKTEAEMVVGGSTLTLEAKVGPNNASDKKLVWTSSDDTIATVENGKVTVNSELSADTTVTIKVASEAHPEKFAECVITVKYIAVTTVKLSKEEVTLSVGGTTKLGATLTGENDAAASNGKVTWSSSDPDLVAVDAEGNLTVNADYRTDGTQVTITATSVADDTKTATCVVTVKYVPVETFELTTSSKSEYTVGVGKTQSVSLNIKDADGTNNYTVKGVTWTSDNDNVTVSSKNNTSAEIAVSGGLRESVVAHITATSVDNPEKKVTVTVTVNYVAVESVTLDKTEAEMEVGGATLTLKATLKADSEEEKATPSVTGVTWSSSDSAVTVNNGVVTVSPTLRENKTVTIKVTAADNPEKFAECVISVKYVPVTGVSVTKQEVALKVGEAASSNASVAPENASVKGLNYKSSDEAVVTVDALGVLRAVKVGTATITVTSQADDTKTTTFTVTVSETTVVEGMNSLYIEQNKDLVYEFTGKPNTAYEFKFPDITDQWSGFKVCKDEYNYAAGLSLIGTTDENGKFNVCVVVPFSHSTFYVRLSIAEFVPPEGGDGSLEFPYELTLGKECSASGVGAYSGACGTIVIKEEGDYLLEGTGAKLLIGTEEFSSYWSGGYTMYTTTAEVTVGNTAHLQAGTYNVVICSDAWNVTEVTFTLTKV